jgi:hypothetical protein
MSSDLFTHFKPNADELLQRISCHIDDGMLEEIAAADYGWKAQECLITLRPMRDRGSFTFPLSFEVREVLELIRWSQPDDPKWKPGGHGERGHWMRAFACAALLRSSADAETRAFTAEGWNQTLIQLIDSLRVVGYGPYEHAAAMVAWLILECEMDQEVEELGFLGVGLLWFGLNLRPTVADDVVIALANWITVQEKQASDNGPNTRNNYWLLRTTFYNARHESWKRLGSTLAGLDLGKRSPAARESVALIATALSGEQAALARS